MNIAAWHFWNPLDIGVVDLLLLLGSGTLLGLGLAILFSAKLKPETGRVVPKWKD